MFSFIDIDSDHNMVLLYFFACFVGRVSLNKFEVIF